MDNKNKVRIELAGCEPSGADAGVAARQDNESSRFNQLLLDSLPHPAMLIERDRKVLAANRIARQLGAAVGGYCWRDFARSEYLSEHHKALINNHSSAGPAERIKCTFCLADEALAEQQATNEPELRLFGRLWDTWWVPIDSSCFLHYAIDITKQKQIERELAGYRDQLEKVVEERTRELKIANDQLRLEIAERMQMEEALRHSEERFRSMFEKSKAIKLLIDPASGGIVDANPAACAFYGYRLDQLKAMTISQINTLLPNEVAAEMALATTEQRNHFFFKHRLASGEIREVEVHSNPIKSGERTLLFSIIHDITARRHAEVLLKLERNKFLNIANSTENAVLIIGADFDIRYLNPVAEKEFGPAGKRRCYEYLHDKSQSCEWCKKQEILAGKSFHTVWTYGKNRKTYDIFEAPFRDSDGTMAILEILHDVTKHKQIEEALRLDEARLQVLLELSQMTEASIDRIADFVLEQAVRLTKSDIGALLLMDEQEDPTAVFYWPGEVAAPVAVTGNGDFPLGGTGFWQEAIGKREPVIVNHCCADCHRLAGDGPDHPLLFRLLITPIVFTDRVMAVAAVANKAEAYEMSDARQLTLLLDGMCKFIQRKTAEDAIRESERRLRHLSSRLLTVQEQERERLAKELHDKVGQTFAAIKFGLESALRAPASGGAQAAFRCLDALLPVVSKSIEDVRKMYTDLRPTILDDFGVVAAVGWLCREFSEAHPHVGIRRQLDIHEADIPKDLRIIIFRLVQEALNNVADHSRAGLVNISLRRVENRLDLLVEDDGLGFDPKQAFPADDQQAGLGLARIKELTELSAGLFTIKSTPGAGTILCASWPARS